jgi:hypothetical protein
MVQKTRKSGNRAYAEHSERISKRGIAVGDVAQDLVALEVAPEEGPRGELGHEVEDLSEGSAEEQYFASERGSEAGCMHGMDEFGMCGEKHNGMGDKEQPKRRTRRAS